MGSCLWALVDVGSFFVAVGKLPAVSKAILKVVNGVSKFFEEASKARKVLDRAAKLIADGRKARRPDIEVCELDIPAAFRTAGAIQFRTTVLTSNATSVFMLAAKIPCKVKRVAVLDRDIVAKGAHVNMEGDLEVRIVVDEAGNLLGLPHRSAGGRYPTAKHLKVAVDHLLNSREDRTKLFNVLTQALDLAARREQGYVVNDVNQIKRIQAVCAVLKKLGVN